MTKAGKDFKKSANIAQRPVKSALKKWENPDTPKKLGDCLWLLIAGYTKDVPNIEETALEWINRGANVRIRNASDCSILQTAISNAPIKIIKRLLASDAVKDINHTTCAGSTPLECCALRKAADREDVVRLLVRAGANPVIRPDVGKWANIPNHYKSVVKVVAEEALALAHDNAIENIERLAHEGAARRMKTAPIPAFIKKPFIPGGKKT